MTPDAVNKLEVTKSSMPVLRNTPMKSSFGLPCQRFQVGLISVYYVNILAPATGMPCYQYLTAHQDKDLSTLTVRSIESPAEAAAGRVGAARWATYIT